MEPYGGYSSIHILYGTHGDSEAPGLLSYSDNIYGQHASYEAHVVEGEDDGYTDEQVDEAAEVPSPQPASRGRDYDDGIGSLRRSTTSSASNEQTLSASQISLQHQQAMSAAQRAPDWNFEFQSLLERPVRSPEEAHERANLIGELINAFVEAATPTARTVVEEEDMKLKDKTIPPVNVGGVAGGIKYVYGNMFIKFASKDPYKIYGSESKAAKSAAHEINSLQALIESNITNLHFPLQIIVDYLGRRLSMSSILPIDTNTLVYGSGDAGKTIHATNPEARAIMRQVAEKLNLKPHLALELSTNKQIMINTAVDLEGHAGHDGRYYVCDTARLFPPEPPIKREKGSAFFRLLRRELLHANAVPLSPDAFTNFGKLEAEVNNLEVKLAWDRMLVVQIPACIAELEKIFAAEVSPSFFNPKNNKVSRIMHQFGINTRYLLVIRALTTNVRLRAALLIEAVARAVKREFYENLRIVPSSDIEQHKGLAASILNLLFGRHDLHSFWLQMPEKLRQRFPFLPDTSRDGINSDIDGEEGADVDLREAVFTTSPSALLGQQHLFEWVVHQCGLQLGYENLDYYVQRNIHSSDVFVHGDIIDITPRVKAISVEPLLEKLRQEASGGAPKEELIQHYRDQLRQREDALGPAHPLVAFSLENCGDIMISAGDMNAAIDYLIRALKIRRENFEATPNATPVDQIPVADTLEKLASAYHSFSLYQEAEMYAREARSIIEGALGPESQRAVNLMHMQAWLLKGMGKYEQSAELFERAIKIASSAESGSPARPGKSTKSSSTYRSTLADSLVEYARVLLHLGRHVDSTEVERIIAMQEQALSICEGIWGPEHSRVATILNNLAIVLIWKGEYPRARQLCERSLQIRRSALGESHPYTGHSASALGQLLMFCDNLNDAELMLNQSVEVYRRSKRSEPIAMGLANLARLKMTRGIQDSDVGHFKEAIALLEQAVALISTLRKDRQSQDQVATFLVDLAAAKLALSILTHESDSNDTDSPLVLLQRAKEIRLASLPPQHPNVFAIDNLVKLCSSKSTDVEMIVRQTDRLFVSQLTLYKLSR